MLLQAECVSSPLEFTCKCQWLQEQKVKVKVTHSLLSALVCIYKGYKVASWDKRNVDSRSNRGLQVYELLGHVQLVDVPFILVTAFSWVRLQRVQEWKSKSRITERLTVCSVAFFVSLHPRWSHEWPLVKAGHVVCPVPFNLQEQTTTRRGRKRKAIQDTKGHTHLSCCMSKQCTCPKGKKVSQSVCVSLCPKQLHSALQDEPWGPRVWRERTRCPRERDEV